MAKSKKQKTVLSAIELAKRATNFLGKKELIDNNKVAFDNSIKIASVTPKHHNSKPR